ncbi:MAG TPA: PepSY-associated TM helix domain-containing protein [Phnomibacter sp.]|nr:PepSY-associated TM helix domain-containing protein [Phnomibacter sp.]
MKYKIKIAGQTRWYRRWHKWIGIGALFFLTLMATSGLLLTWKKNSGGYLLADTQKGSSADPSVWLGIDSIQRSAIHHLNGRVPGSDLKVDRIDIRPEKGIAKVTFKAHYNAVQVDLATGKALLLEKRRADFIEHLHDGSILDRISGWQWPKLFYGSLVGLSLLFLCFSGFWLWYNPKRIKKLKAVPLQDP